MVEKKEFPTSWRFVHWFPSNKYEGDQACEFSMKSYWDGDALVLESLPKEDHSYMFVRLRILDDIATGYWHETSSPTGEFKGAQYSGAGQLVVNPTTYSMEGKWAGAGYDRKLKRMRIYSGNWEISPRREAAE